MVRISILDTKDKIGESVELAGWVSVRRDHGKIVFIDVRDRSGVVQVVFTPKNNELYEVAEKLRPEWVVRVKGMVAKRPEAMVNKEIPTGKIEIQPDVLEILAEAETPPFALDTNGYEIGEEVRMKYRYLDLRRERLRNNLIARHTIVKFIRDFLSERGFLEIETPIITKSTPEGARDYVVPSRMHAGKFYALPQSPQQYKQLLMVAGVEKYFQIPRCFRDEDTRGDRQPEFTQLDLEMSFVTRDDVLDLTEELYLELVKKLYPEKRISTLDKNGKILRLTHAEVMNKYGTDKPDIRKDKNDPHELAFLFVTDFPMFERKDDGSLGAVHHPFTKMQIASLEEAEALKGNDQKIEQQLAEQYDFVLNGYEIGGGSIREHNPKILQIVFEILGHAPEQIKNQFGHLLSAFQYGVPPHGGIAPGIDRLIMVLQNEPNIREVIAFPKTGDARDLMMDAPSELSSAQLEDLHISVKKEKK